MKLTACLDRSFFFRLVSSLFAVISISPLAMSQQPEAQFVVVSLPAKCNYSKEKLNQEIRLLSSKQQVRQFIALKKFPPVPIIIKINDRNNGSAPYWTYNVFQEKEIIDDHVSFESKNIVSVKFYKISDFKTVFKDTLVLLDTIKIELYLHNPAYADDAFVLEDYCGNKKMSNQSIPVDGVYLTILPTMLSQCGKGLSKIRIFNRESSQRTIAFCHLKFLSPDEKQQLHDIYSDLQIQFPTHTAKQLQSLLDSFIRKNYGTVYFPHLTRWLRSISD